MIHLRSELFGWYDAEESHGIPHTRVQAFVVPMLGHRERPNLGLHGAETNGFLSFACAHLLPQKGRFLLDREPLWRSLIVSLKTIVDVIYSYKRSERNRMSAPDIQLFCDCTRTVMRSMGDLELQHRPKCHMLMEMAARTIN